jgi:transcriptional regulator with XRE-family HTH domain
VADERGLKQRDLAQAADMNVTAISHIERGRANPAWGTVRRIAAALGVPVSEVAGRAERLVDDS